MSRVLTKSSWMFLLVVLILATTLNGTAQLKSSVLDNPRITPIEVVPIVELPFNLQDAVLSKTKKGYVLQCLLSNNSDSRMLGVDYLLLLIDSNNTTRAIINGTEDLKVEPNASRSLISRKTLHVEVGDGYRLILIPQRVFSPHSFWEVHNARKVLEKYASGDYSLKPEVTRATNLVDTPIGGTRPR